MDIVEIYLECRDFHKSVQESGLPIHVAHLRLLRAGVLNKQDEINCTSRSSRLGVEAERLFQKLVPEAINTNQYFKKNNPDYDFIFKEVSIDVKYSSRHRKKDSNSNHWQIRITGKQDIIVAFLEKDFGHELDDPIILLLPMQFLRVKKDLHISEVGEWYSNYRIEPEELQPMLREYAKSKRRGCFLK